MREKTLTYRDNYDIARIGENRCSHRYVGCTYRNAIESERTADHLQAFSPIGSGRYLRSNYSAVTEANLYDVLARARPVGQRGTEDTCRDTAGFRDRIALSRHIREDRIAGPG